MDTFKDSLVAYLVDIGPVEWLVLITLSLLIGGVIGGGIYLVSLFRILNNKYEVMIDYFNGKPNGWLLSNCSYSSEPKTMQFKETQELLDSICEIVSEGASGFREHFDLEGDDKITIRIYNHTKDITSTQFTIRAINNSIKVEKHT